MSSLVVPPLEEEPWPTLGPAVCDFIESNLVFGPGDLRGEPAKLDPEQRALVYRMYEVHPKGSPRAGKRRFQRVALSLRKGSRKTEFAAWIAAVELHPDGPVRCDGFRKEGGVWVPVGRPVNDPYIPLLAYTEEQSEELAYGALYAMLSDSNCPLADDFDIGLERIMRITGDGKAVALANAPDSRDGARTTFQHKDETHRWTLPRMKEADKATRANLLKRPIADPWELETTTMYAPGEGSVAEGTHDYAKQVAAGAVKDSRLFYFHRQASDKYDLDTDDGLRNAVLEASGLIAEWSDIDGIISQFHEPDADRSYLIRVWLNMPVRAATKAFDAERWKQLVSDHECSSTCLIVAGFDGSRRRDATALVATCVETGKQWPVGIWYPENGEIDANAVNVAVDELFSGYKVWRLYADPPYWESEIADWKGRYGDERVVEWFSWRNRPMAAAVLAYSEAILNGAVTHSGDAQLASHIGNTYRRQLTVVDDKGQRLWVMQKERPDSPHKIDAAMAACLAWEARTDAISSGAGKQKEVMVAWR